MRTIVLSVALLGFVGAARPTPNGAPPAPAPKAAKVTAPDDALPQLLAKQAELKQFYGDEHPEVVRTNKLIELTNERDAKPAEVKKPEDDAQTVTGLMLVLTDHRVGAVFRDPQVHTLSGRSFIVGKHVENNFVIGEFVGTTVWIPVTDIVQVVELEPAKGKPAGKAEPAIKGPVFVEARAGRRGAVLEAPVGRALGARRFVVGLSVKNKLVEDGPAYAGKTVWLPSDDVIRLVELGPQPEPEKK